MPLSDDQRRAFATRLQSAYMHTRDLNETRPWVHEIVPDHALGQDWPIIISAYSGIEQTLKFLIALDRGISVEELTGGGGFRTHRLGFLFQHLEAERKRAAERYYTCWQSLHCYVSVPACEALLELLQEEDGRGYEHWRYCLAQIRPPVANSADAMLAIWAALLRQAPALPFPMVDFDDEIRDGLWMALDTACANEEGRSIEHGESTYSTCADRDRWIHSHTHLLDAMAQALCHYEKYGDFADEAGSPPWRNALCNCVRELRRQARQESRRGSVHMFTQRASGWLPIAESIRWSYDKGSFQDVPWALESESRNEPPPDAQIVDFCNGTDAQLRRLRYYAKARGHLLKESRAFAWRATGEDRTWHLRLRLYDHHQGTDRPRLSIWQRGDLEGPTAVEHHRAEPPLPAELEAWVQLYIRPLRFNRAPS